MRRQKEALKRTPTERGQSRRRLCLLWLCGTLCLLDFGLISGILAPDLVNGPNPSPALIEPSETSTPTTTATPTQVATEAPTQNILPPEIDYEAAIAATATALPPNSETNFQPNLEFTWADYDLLRNSVFQLTAGVEDAEGKAHVLSATCWVVGSNQDTLFLATNAHVLNLNADDTAFIAISRPSVDDRQYIAEEVHFSLHPSLDLAIISFPLQEHTLDHPAPPLTFQEDRFPNGEAPLIVLGFPGVTGDYLDMKNSLTFVTTSEVIPYINENTDYNLISFGTTGHGMSGSPVATWATPNGELRVIGILRAGSRATQFTNDGSQERNVYFVERLDLSYFNIPGAQLAELYSPTTHITAKKQEFLLTDTDVIKTP